MPADAKVLGLFVDADDAPNPGGLPVGGVTMIDLPNNHLQYAVTWYGLAAALVGSTCRGCCAGGAAACVARP
jgi:surfeit locus 1 family protein